MVMLTEIRTTSFSGNITSVLWWEWSGSVQGFSFTSCSPVSSVFSEKEIENFSSLGRHRITAGSADPKWEPGLSHFMLSIEKYWTYSQISVWNHLPYLEMHFSKAVFPGGHWPADVTLLLHSDYAFSSLVYKHSLSCRGTFLFIKVASF